MTLQQDSFSQTTSMPWTVYGLRPVDEQRTWFWLGSRPTQAEGCVLADYVFGEGEHQKVALISGYIAKPSTIEQDAVYFLAKPLDPVAAAADDTLRWNIYAYFASTYNQPWRWMESWPPDREEHARQRLRAIFNTYNCERVALHRGMLGSAQTAGHGAVLVVAKHLRLVPRLAPVTASVPQVPPPPIIESTCREVVLSAAKDWHVWYKTKGRPVWTCHTDEPTSYAEAQQLLELVRETYNEVTRVMAFNRNQAPNNKRIPTKATKPAPPAEPAIEPRRSTRVFSPGINRLHAMLQFKRPHMDPCEQIFIHRFLAPLGTKADAYGNRWLYIKHTVGTDSPIMWSCHTDTCHREGGMQDVFRHEHEIFADPKKSNCLGADDTAGVWLMTEMIQRRVPGLYLFHRGEERGGLGSKWLSSQASLKDHLSAFKYAIALDRRGTGDIITRQHGGRCCSDKFAESLAACLAPLKYKTCTGTFTDTANYIDLIPECTNISVGYEQQHTSSETLDGEFCEELLETICKADFRQLVVARKTTDPKYDSYSGGSYGGGYSGSGSSYYGSSYEPSSLYNYVRARPTMVEAFLEEMGISIEDLKKWDKEQPFTETSAWKRKDLRKEAANVH